MKILVTGQLSLHWGRLEFGNIGNFYIISPLFYWIHETLPSSEVFTTFQLSQKFAEIVRVKVLPKELFYDFDNPDVELAQNEVNYAVTRQQPNAFGNILPEISRSFLSAIDNIDLVLDVGGDMWSDNSSFVGTNRLEIGLLKDMTIQSLGKPLALFAASVGPFATRATNELARTTYQNFSLVTHREPVSSRNSLSSGFINENSYDLACPSFLFSESLWPSLMDCCKPNEELDDIVNLHESKIGFVICGWNFLEGPYNKVRRSDEEFLIYVSAIEYIIKNMDAKVILFSHNNGFIPPPDPFTLLPGRDFVILQQLHSILVERGLGESVELLKFPLLPHEMAKLIASFEMLITGRIHASVAAFLKQIPTLIIDYGHEPKASKLLGFAELMDTTSQLVSPDMTDVLCNRIQYVWDHRDSIACNMYNRLPYVQELARQNFQLLTLFN